MTSLHFAEGQESPSPIAAPPQLLPNLIDGIANIRPESTWAKVPRSTTSWNKGVLKITYRLFANAVNETANWLLSNVGTPTQSFQSVAYFGLYDPRYAILTVGAMKAGFKAVFPSAARGADGVLAFLRQIECDVLLTALPDVPLTQELAAQGIRVLRAPSLEQLLQAITVHVPYTKTFAQARDDPILVLHTSGSTGIPKPLVYTNDWAATWMAQNQSPAPPGFRSLDYLTHGVEMFAFAPQAHSGGFYSNLLGAVANQIVCVYPLPTSGLTLESMFETLRHTSVDFLVSPPHVLDQVALNPDHVSFLANHVRLVGFGGGPLSERSGNILSQHVVLFPTYGTGEDGIWSKILPDQPWRPEWWNCLVPNPECGVEMRPISGIEDSYEAVVVRKGTQAQPVFKMMPDLNEWPTKDVFHGKAAPQYGPGFILYSYAHRRDDCIQLMVTDPVALISRRSIVPLQFEQHLSGTELIKSALVFGERRPYPGLIVELASTDLVEEPGIHARIQAKVEACIGLLGVGINGGHVLIADPKKPLPRALKGTVQRESALRLYEKEIESMYGKAAS